MLNLYSTLLTTILSLIPAIIAVRKYIKSRHRHAIRWVKIPPETMLVISDQVIDNLEITFDGKQIKNLTKFQFILHNIGTKLLDKDAIVAPLTWTAPGRVLGARVVLSKPRVKLFIQQKNNRVEIYWDLFNPNCKALIELICDCDPGSGAGTVEGEIRNISEISEREIYFTEYRKVDTYVQEQLSRLPRILTLYPIKDILEPIFELMAQHPREVNMYLISLLISIFSGVLTAILVPWKIDFKILCGLVSFGIVWASMVYLLEDPYARFLGEDRVHQSRE